MATNHNPSLICFWCFDGASRIYGGVQRTRFKASWSQSSVPTAPLPPTTLSQSSSIRSPWYHRVVKPNTAPHYVALRQNHRIQHTTPGQRAYTCAINAVIHNPGLLCFGVVMEKAGFTAASRALVRTLWNRFGELTPPSCFLSNRSVRSTWHHRRSSKNHNGHIHVGAGQNHRLYPTIHSTCIIEPRVTRIRYHNLG
ncbi:hypothetical protein K505DRAFT_9219 [Melanomma pulvis-pyrius CBS 109.77]|uniref:Uncharacterized protein n=1 Tax=Melanomma pulvis-pyrius CBS 109.77 TaxID=1314802 RepID=A0A6A6XI24_9PLEO|nr:hypothetical protein K505DRAFT_9219 [Melanomma pulvis-pyrius CBS 109.77]